MSVTHNKQGAEMKREIREIKAAEANSAALLSLSFKAQIVQPPKCGLKNALPPPLEKCS